MKQTVINGDFLTCKIPQLEDTRIGLVVTSPPYNVGKDYGATCNDNLPYLEYLEFTKKWLTRCYKIMSSHGRLCVNIPFEHRQVRHFYHDFLSIAFGVGFKYYHTIIWNTQGTNARTAWGSFCSPSQPAMVYAFECIVVFYKETKKKPCKHNDITNDEFTKWTYAIWTLHYKKKTGHPAPFPLKIPTRLIKLFSCLDDWILDPFLGTGTTLVACKKLKRNAIGVEINPDYCQLAENWLGITDNRKNMEQLL